MEARYGGVSGSTWATATAVDDRVGATRWPGGVVVSVTDIPGDSDDSEDTGDSLADLADAVADRRNTDTDEESVDNAASHADTLDDLAVTDETDSSVDDFAESASASQTETADPGTNALVLGALRGHASEASCIDLLVGPETAEPLENVLFVTVTQDADARLDALRSHAAETPKRVAVVQSGSDNRKRTHTRATGSEGLVDVTVHGVDHPSDLTRLGITVTRILKEWTNVRGRVAVCLHSLTGLLQYVGQERLFRFVHILQAKLDGANVTAHFHMDPDAHAPDTLSVFRSLFDTVISVDDDGTVEVTTGER